MRRLINGNQPNFEEEMKAKLIRQAYKRCDGRQDASSTFGSPDPPLLHFSYISSSINPKATRRMLRPVCMTISSFKALLLSPRIWR